MKRKILVDTSVWIECVQDEQLRKALENIADKFEIRSTEVIEEEIGKVAEFLRKKKLKERAEFLKNFYLKFKKPVIGSTTSVKKLAGEYLEECRSFRISPKKLVNDFTIVSAASIDAVNFIATLNRKSMTSDIARSIYAIVNSKHNLRTPDFLNNKESIRRISYE